LMARATVCGRSLRSPGSPISSGRTSMRADPGFRREAGANQVTRSARNF
jgi:hypothetical protein